MVSIRQLRYLDAVARLGHFGQAADHCAVSQPALSMQIRELEKELGLQLIERLPKTARLTAAGNEVVRRGQRVLAEIRDLDDFARHHNQPLTGELRFGIIPTIAPYLLPKILAEVKSTHPQLQLQVRESQTRTLLAQLDEGSLDLLLLALPIDIAGSRAGIQSEDLFVDRFVLAVPADRELTEPFDANDDTLAQEHLLLLEEGHCLRDQALTFLALKAITQIDTFGASSLATIVQLVAGGMGSTLLPEIAIPVETDHRAVKLVRFAEPQPSRSIGLAWRKTSARDEEFRQFGQLITRLAEATAE